MFANSSVLIPLAGEVPSGLYAALPRKNLVDEPRLGEARQAGDRPLEDGRATRRSTAGPSSTPSADWPTPDETRAFLADADPVKREKLDRPPARPARVRRPLGQQVGRPAPAEPVPRWHQGRPEPRCLAPRRLPPQPALRPVRQADPDRSREQLPRRRLRRLARPPRARGGGDDRQPGLPRHPARMRQVPPPPVRVVGPGAVLRVRRLLRQGRPQGGGDRPADRRGRGDGLPQEVRLGQASR